MASIGPKKDGSPNIEFFQSPECLTAFEGIRIWLQKNCKKVRISLWRFAILNLSGCFVASIFFTNK